MRAGVCFGRGGGNGCWRATAKLLIPPADTPCGTDDGLC